MSDTAFSKSKRLFNKSQDLWFLLVIILLMFAWKLVLFVQNSFPFNSDEAIVALMAKHIVNGERPIFFYGQAYMGSLDAYLVALGYMIFGQKVFVIRLVQSLLYAGTIVITYFIGKTAFHSVRAARISAVLLAIPTVNVTLYTTVSLGGYGEALLIGVAEILLALKICERINNHQSYSIRLLPLAFLSSFGLWVNGLTMVFTLPVWVYLLWQFIRAGEYQTKLAKRVLIIVAGGVLGLFPLLIFVAQNGVQAVWMELFGSAVAVEQGNWLVRAGSHLLYLILFGIPVMLGIRPPWSSEVQLIWLLPLILPMVLATGFQLYLDIRKKQLSPATYLFFGIIFVLFAAFIGTSFGVDPSGRYFVPLIIPAALLSSYALDTLIQKNWFLNGLLVAFVVYQAAVTFTLSMKLPYITTQFYEPAMVNHDYDAELISFLDKNDLQYGYSNYWVAYPLAFLSGEELIYVPALPYHPDLKFTERDNRYDPYNEIVGSSTEANYIVTRNPELDSALCKMFAVNNINYDYHEIGDFHIYYHLSDMIRPDQFDLLEYRE